MYMCDVPKLCTNHDNKNHVVCRWKVVCIYTYFHEFEILGIVVFVYTSKTNKWWWWSQMLVQYDLHGVEIIITFQISLLFMHIERKITYLWG